MIGIKQTCDSSITIFPDFIIPEEIVETNVPVKVHGQSIAISASGQLWEDTIQSLPLVNIFIHSDINTDEIEKQRLRNQGAIKLLKQWLADDSGYDEQVWPMTKTAIDNNRLSDRKRFDE